MIDALLVLLLAAAAGDPAAPPAPEASTAPEASAAIEPAATPAAPDAPSEPTPAPESSSAPAAAEDDPKVCRLETVTGSIRPRRVCRSLSEIRAAREVAQDTLDNRTRRGLPASSGE